MHQSTVSKCSGECGICICICICKAGQCIRVEFFNALSNVANLPFSAAANQVVSTLCKHAILFLSSAYLVITPQYCLFSSQNSANFTFAQLLYFCTFLLVCKVEGVLLMEGIAICQIWNTPLVQTFKEPPCMCWYVQGWYGISYALIWMEMFCNTCTTQMNQLKFTSSFWFILSLKTCQHENVHVQILQQEC